MLYKNYQTSPMATAANAFIRMIGYFMLLASILEGINGESYNWILIGGAFILMLIINRVADKCSDKIASKSQSKTVAKENSFNLLQTKINSQGEEVLDIPEEVLFVPATITLKRMNSFIGILAKFKYVVNETEVYKLGNNSSVVIKTTKPVNTITLKLSQGTFNDPSLVKFTVKSGENVEVSYKAREFSWFIRE